ncbi:MAG: ABC transporter ATP-binding protein [Kiloniellales bacterium]|nr:ABC transporter ATP-binding protein [Kiloniellales bacterium]
MYYIRAKDLVIEFPIYSSTGRSLRHYLVIDRLRAPSRQPSLTENIGGRIIFDGHGRRTVRAIDGIDFAFEEGDRVGILGHNGAGKSTLLKCIAGILEPIAGSVEREGRVSPMFSLNEGMDPDSTGIENIVLRCRVMGLDKAEIDKVVADVSEFCRLGEYLDMPMHTYSSGMLVRLAFGIATALPHEILVMDEMIGAGDAAFVEQAQKRLEVFIDRARIVVLASHSEAIIRYWCNKVMILNHGEIAFTGSVDEGLSKYYEMVHGAPPTEAPAAG